MARNQPATARNVEPFPAAFASQSVNEELKGILAMLRQAFPDAANIGLDFDGRLRAHIDVRKREQVMLVEITLPTLGAGRFHTIKIGGTPNHPFLHRISAMVEA